MTWRRRAMTLLEVVVATAALASISVLVAALWAQTRDWALENAGHHDALRVERALTLLDDQWRRRVRTATVDGAAERAAAVALTPDTLAFITTTPILFREWPMARVTIRLDRPLTQTVGRETPGRILYTESPVRDPSASATRPDATPDEERTLVLLDGVLEVRFERWADERDAARDPAETGAGWREVRDRLIERALADDPRDPAAPAPADADPSAPRPDPRDEPRALRAGRLVASRNGDPIVWQFLAAPSP